MVIATSLNVHLVGETSAYVAAVAALVGVVLGGFLNATMTWLLDRNRRRARARVAALLVTEELTGSLLTLIEMADSPTWMTLRRERDFGMRDAWEEHRATLGYAVSPNTYVVLAAAYRGIARAAGRAADDPPDTRPSDSEEKSLTHTFLNIVLGLTDLSILVNVPTPLRPLLRPVHKRTRDRMVREALADETNFQTLMAKWADKI